MSLPREIIELLKEQKFFTEIVAVPGTTLKIRTNEGLKEISRAVIKPEETKETLVLLRELSGKVAPLERKGIFTFSFRDLGRVRVIYGLQRRSYYFSLLKIPFNPPIVENFFKNPIKFEKFSKIVYNEPGKVYTVFGEDWFINATFLAEIFNALLEMGNKVLFVAENPLSYLLKHKNGIAIQKEIYEDYPNLEEAISDIPLTAPDFIYTFDVLNIFNPPIETLVRYSPRSAGIFLNFPTRYLTPVKRLLEKRGIEKFIALEVSMDYRLGLADFNVVQVSA